MNKKLTNDQSIIDLVARLVKEGSIDFNEAIKLLEVEVEKEYVVYPNPYPVYPDWWNKPYWYVDIQNPTITYGGLNETTTDTILFDSVKDIPFTYTN